MSNHTLTPTALIALLAVTTAGNVGCIGTAIEATTDAAIAVGKIPFKVGEAVVDVATDDDEEKEKDKE